MQAFVINALVDDVEINSRMQNLNMAYSRLMLTLPGARTAIIRMPNPASNQPMLLVVTHNLTNGIRQRTYWLDAENAILRERGEWIHWNGSGSRPGAYSSPIASSICEFKCEVKIGALGSLLEIKLRSGDYTREFSIFLRNTD
jgi:hypothetical protein